MTFYCVFMRRPHTDCDLKVLLLLLQIIEPVSQAPSPIIVFHRSLFVAELILKVAFLLVKSPFVVSIRLCPRLSMGLCSTWLFNHHNFFFIRFFSACHTWLAHSNYFYFLCTGKYLGCCQSLFDQEVLIILYRFYLYGCEHIVLKLFLNFNKGSLVSVQSIPHRVYTNTLLHYNCVFLVHTLPIRETQTCGRL